MDKIFFLAILLFIIIIMLSCNKNYNEHMTTENMLDKTRTRNSPTNPKDKKNKPPQVNPEETEEKYYDYKYTYNAGPSIDKIKSITKDVISEKDSRPININISYPPPPQNIEQNNDRIVYYDTTLLQNLTGNPVDQVETDYSVIEDDSMYKSWDKYYLPGYSYFPPSKWQLPRDNALVVPKELRDEKCDVCPLVANNGSDNYLSGDILQSNSIKNIPDNKDIITKYTTVNKGVKEQPSIPGSGTTIASYTKTKK